MEKSGQANAILVRLEELGVQLQIDDFGTGYSSMSYLHHFPIHTIKIDRSFISRIGMNGDNSEIVNTIVALARDLGMEAIAEGVETEEQLRQLKALNCHYGQGFFIARPMDAESIEKLLTK
jgi:EAL domain-containing protein (putative c-di-GMP-specific phosphodiesterase class I)